MKNKRDVSWYITFAMLLLKNDGLFPLSEGFIFNVSSVTILIFHILTDLFCTV